MTLVLVQCSSLPHLSLPRSIHSILSPFLPPCIEEFVLQLG